MEELSHEQHQIQAMSQDTKLMSAPPPGMPQVPPNLNQNQQITQPNNMIPPAPGMPIKHGSDDMNINQLPPPPPPPPTFNPSNKPPPNWDDTDEIDKSAHNLSSQNTGDVVLPKALEDVFAFKDQLADEMGRVESEIPVQADKTSLRPMTGVISTNYADTEIQSIMSEHAPDTQYFQCNLCLRPLELFLKTSTSNAYLSECLKHMFCEPCKVKIYPKCVCKPQSRFMAINDQMPERYRSLFFPAQNIFQRIKQVEQFQTKQNRINFHRMGQFCQRAQEIIDRIERYDAIEQSRIGSDYLERCKSMNYLIHKRSQQRRKRKSRPKIPPPQNFGQKKFVFKPSRYRNVQPVSPRALEFSSPQTSSVYYDERRNDDSGFDNIEISLAN